MKYVCVVQARMLSVLLTLNASLGEWRWQWTSKKSIDFLGLTPSQQTLHLCRSAHGCLHSDDKSVASESAFDAISDLETLRASVGAERSRDPSL